MAIQEVSLVDRAANLKRFVVVKRDPNMPNATQKMTLKLPTAAKQAISDALAQALDKATALATMVGDAEVDDTAAVPEELNTAMKQIGEMFSNVSSQFAAAPPAAAPPNPEDKAAEGAAPPAPPPGGEQKNADGAVDKALPPPQKDNLSLSTELHEGDSLKQELHKAIAVAHATIATLEKAGRKMAAARYQKLSELHTNLGSLLNDLAYDEAAEKAGAKSDDKGKDGKKAPPPMPPAKKDAAGGEGDGNTLSILKAENAALRLRLGAAETQVAKSAPAGEPPPEPNGGTPEGTEVKKAQEFEWPTDLSASVARKRAARAAEEVAKAAAARR